MSFNYIILFIGLIAQISYAGKTDSEGNLKRKTKLAPLILPSKEVVLNQVYSPSATSKRICFASSSETHAPASPCSSVENRKYPPLGIAAGYFFVEELVPFFTDAEILEVSELSEPEKIGHIYQRKSKKSGKIVIHQKSLRSCTAAASAMLAADHLKSFSGDEVCMRDLGSDMDIVNDLNASGLSCIARKADRIEQLRRYLLEYGSAIVGVADDAIGFHVVIVDEITGEHARIRDPYHGWEITVPISAFIKKWGPSSTIIQIVGE